MSSEKLYKLAIFLHTLINNPDKKFDLTKETRLGDLFNDLVIRVNSYQYTFVSIRFVDLNNSKIKGKHKKISLNKDDSNLKKYFLSYLRITDQLNSRKDKSSVQKLIVFTNSELNHADTIKYVGNIKLIKRRDDNILNTNENSEFYKVNNISEVLIQQLKDMKCDLQILADEMAKYVNENNSNLDLMTSDIDCLCYYHVALLTENVMEIKECQQGNKKLKYGKFSCNFIDGKLLSDRAQRLRTKIIEIVSEKQNNYEKLLEIMAKTEWKLSDNFGESESIRDVIYLPNYEISDITIKDFFGVLELRVKQHSTEEIMKKIKNKGIRDRLLDYFETDPKHVEFLIDDFIQSWKNNDAAKEKWVLNIERSEFINKLKTTIGKPQATQRHVKYIESIAKKYDLQFLDCCTFRENIFLGTRCLLIKTKSIVLSNIKMLEYLRNKNIQNYIFIDLESLSEKREIIKLIDVFRDTNYNLFVLSINNKVADDIINETFSIIYSTFQGRKHVNKQIIIISPKTFSQIEKKIDYKEHIDVTNEINCFVDSSKILMQEITIQGHTKQVGDLCKQVGPEVIDKLLTNKIEIGCSTSETNYMEGAYSELLEEINLESFIFAISAQKSRCTYIVSGIPGFRKSDRFLREIGVTVKSTINTIKNQIEVLEQGVLRTLYKKIYLCGDDLKDKEFKEICKNNPDAKIFWLILKNEGNMSKIILTKIYNPEFYIKGQRFNKEVVIKKTIKEQFCSFQLEEKFIISGTNKRQIASWLRLNGEEEKRFELNCIKMIEFRTFDDDLNDIITGNLNETVHLLKFEHFQLIWYETLGSLDILSKYRTEDFRSTQPLLDEDDIIKVIKDRKTVIISGEPGIGKSTTLVKLYGAIYKMQPSLEESIMMTHWVIRVNLKDYVHLIRNIDYRNSGLILESIISEFLSQVDNSLNDDVAKALLSAALMDKDFGKPLLIAFDGFDEILDKEDRENVLSLLKYLKCKTNAKFWVTTRLHYEKILEKELRTFSIRLEAMDDEKIKLYIQTYLKDHLTLILNREETASIFDNSNQYNNSGFLNEYTEAFLNKLHEIFKTDVSWFIGTPLQLYLMLEGSARYFKQWLQNNQNQKPDFSYLGNDLWGVYEKFIERKYDTYLTKRNVKENVKKKLEKIVFDDFHRDLARSVILGTEIKKSSEGLKDIVISAGLIRSDGENLEFIHPTFQEYFASSLFIHWTEKWTSERQYKLTNKQKKVYFFKEVLSKPYFQVIRIFLNVNLLKENFGNEQLQQQYYNEKILLQAIREKNLGIARFLLYNFQRLNNDNTLEIGLRELPVKDAALSGNLEMLQLLIKYSPNIEDLAKFSSSLLHEAAKSGNLDMVKYLVSNGADLFIRDDCGETVIFKIVTCPTNFEMINYIINKGIDINARDNFSKNALHKAVSEVGNIELVKILVGLGADINAEDKSGETVLYKAAAQPGNCDIVKFLVENNTDIFSSHKKGKIPLEVAVKNNDLEIVRILVKNGFNINIKECGGESIIFSALFGDLDLVKYLVESGIDINVKDKNERTVLHRAVEQPGNIELVKFLVENQVNIKTEDNVGSTVLHKAAAWPGNFEIVKFLVDNDVNIHSRDMNGKTALDVAVQCGDIKVVEYLVENGVDINNCDHNGITVICGAVARSDNLEVVKYLFENGVNISSNADMVFRIAVKYGDLRVLEFLVQNGVKIENRDETGNTILSCAVNRGDFDMVNFLVQNEADVHLRNMDNTTALHVAARIEDMKIVTLLLENGLLIDAGVLEDILVLQIAAKLNNVKMLNLLIRYTSNIDNLGKLHTFLLHDAIENGSLNVVKYLVENGADVNDQDKSGTTVIYKAVVRTDIYRIYNPEDNENTFIEDNDLQIVQFLLKNGIQIHKPKDSFILLEKAAELGRLNILQALVKYCKDVGYINEYCSSILLDATKSRNLDLIKLLVKNVEKLKLRSYSSFLISD